MLSKIIAAALAAALSASPVCAQTRDFIGTWGTINLDPNTGNSHLTLTESGATDTSQGTIEQASIYLDLQNINNSPNYKHGLDCVLWVANSSSAENADCIALMTYHEYATPSQGAAEASAFYATETGGGNTLSIFNLAENAPTGLPADYNDGRAIEVGVDGNKVGISIDQNGRGGNGGGKGLWVLTADATTGIQYQPYDDYAGATRALQIINAHNTAEMAYITKGGTGYFSGGLIVDGTIVAGGQPAASCPAGMVNLSTLTIRNGIVTHC